LGLFTGLGAIGLLRFVVDTVLKWKVEKVRMYVVVIVIIIGVLVGGALVQDDTLISLQIEDQKNIIDPEINQLLYDYFGDDELQPIFTNYYLRYLPGFEDLQVNIGGFKDYDFYRQKREEFPDVKYMLISLYAYDEDVMVEVYNKIAQGDYEVIFEHNKYLFVKILKD
jgi:hypothetical protein